MSQTSESSLQRDPTVWRPPLFDREQRWNNPSIVGNILKDVPEVSNIVAGNSTIPTATFMQGRLVFSGAATGTKTLPTAADIVKYLETYYSQVIGRTTSPQEVKEISVEFYNSTANPITLGTATGLTLQGNAANYVIPANTIAQYKFVVEQTTPTPAVSVFPLFAPANSAAALLPQAPGQLVDYNPATGQLGYITNAVLASQGTGTQVMGWDTATSTPSQISLALGTPQQALTRNAATGALVYSGVANYPNGTVTTIPIGINATTGVWEKVDPSAISALSFRSQVAAETVPDAATTIVTYDTATTSAANVSYNAGIFTVTAPGSYIVCVDYAFAAATANTGSYISLRYGSPPTTISNEVYRSGEIIKNGSFSVPFSADSTFTQFCVTITNAEGGVITLSTGGGGQGIRNAVKVMRVQ